MEWGRKNIPDTSSACTPATKDTAQKPCSTSATTVVDEFPNAFANTEGPGGAHVWRPFSLVTAVKIPNIEIHTKIKVCNHPNILQHLSARRYARLPERVPAYGSHAEYCSNSPEKEWKKGLDKKTDYRLSILSVKDVSRLSIGRRQVGSKPMDE